MFASDTTEVGWIIFSFSVLIFVVVLVFRRMVSKLNVKAGPVQASVDLTPLHEDLKAVREMVTQVNEAVNHRQEHEPTLVQRVKDMESDFFVHQQYERIMFDWQNEAITRLCQQVGLQLSDPPSSIPPKERQSDGTHQ